MERPVSNELRDELGLELDEYRKPAVYKTYNALARVIVNLLFLKPGTYPDKPLMGINIEQYKFEFLDDQTLAKLELDIMDQLKTYIQDTSPIDLKLEILKDNENKKMLGLGISVSNADYETDTFFLHLKQDQKTNDVLAEFIM